MPVTFTEAAAKIVIQSIRDGGLNPVDFGITLGMSDDSLSMTFTNDFPRFNTQYELKVNDDDIQEDILLETWRDSNGKSGIIIMERNEHPNPPPVRSV